MKLLGICTDIDGTLLDSRRQLSSRTIAAIKNLGKTIPVILASSRMPSAMLHLQEELDILHHPMICYNGGYVIHYESSSPTPVVLETVKIPFSICSKIIGMANETSLHISLFSEDNWYAPKVDNWTEREERITKASAIIMRNEEVLNMWRETENGAHKIMCMGDEQEIEQMGNELEEKFGEQIHIYRSKSTYLELAPRSISKASGLERLLQERFSHITMADMAAFGDNYNDIEMLKAVGMGIAVGSARDEVKAAAKEITANSKEDGVAIAIEKYFK
ncbi:Cof-type HAD-IIB family hydrolase [Pontibacter sp. SGAir0037]|uniref:Cof-type HAD-IIB family hydrolase n=1 Tax=Pontibacter sp. SGAir0037 TaxID=2571030 RepID=UPI0010CD05C0|nr:Cof-type HAD-IIB family hydrolase [Pontibacter sp. SGAir0037]QCR22673.1 Cof-type HAD-IIB family hydrolase [Pontibacter sp. SGAir0037]